MMAIHLDKKGNVSVDNEIASEYGKSGFENFIEKQREKGNILYEDKKIGLDNLSRVGLQLPKAGDVSDPINTIYQKSENVNTPLKAQVDEMRKAGRTDDEILEELEKQGVNAHTAMEIVDGGVEELDPRWVSALDEAYNNPPKDFKSAEERIKYEAPTTEEFKARVEKADRNREVSDAFKNIKEAYFNTDQLKEMADINEAKGMFDRVGGMTQQEARNLAEAELKNKGAVRMAEDFVNNDLPTDGHVTAARAEVILRELTEAANKGEVDNNLYFAVVEKAAIEFASTSGRNLNAVKMMYRATPEGRVRIIEKQVKDLADEFADRLKGKEIKLTDEELDAIRGADTEDKLADIAKKITTRVWDEIPSSFVEKVNMFRKISMLFNVKTNLRNLGGNLTLRGARNISDNIEHKLTAKVFKNTLEKNKIESVMSANVTREEIASAREYLGKEVFAENYKKSDSTNRLIERRRPTESTVLPGALGKAEKATFAVLEAGDVIPSLRPAYVKAYIRWCKKNGIKDVKNIDNLRNMTSKQKTMANAYAMHQAEVASFRDASALADKINKLKLKTETGTGKTVAGTAGLRLGNMALESVLPFVKTPINVFRRSIDYSPISLVRAANELLTFKAKGDADALLNGIHHLATGLTGSGITALGLWLATQDIIKVDVMAKAGEASGDAFYDRDMGYQDYSLIIGGKSITIDWMSPVQTSFFMGAQVANICENNDEINGMDYFNAGLTLFEPHLEASFMSSAKDMFEMFAETAVGDGSGNHNWGEAILTTLGGTIPQNYLNSILNPQLLSQTAQATDKYQRDTRSTKENPLAKSWDSWGKKVANRFPVLRQQLNPKLDSRGNDVKTQGDNVLTRVLHAFANPSNVKNIRFDELDREIIKNYNEMEEGRDKDYYYYNFTGNPDYDLGNGKRMTYDEAYKYGKESRQQQSNALWDMIKAPRYKNMTPNMKTDEMKATHDIGNVYADRKVYGDTFAADKIAEYSQTDSEVREKLKSMGGNDKSFVEYYIQKETVISQAHDTSRQTKAIAAVKCGDELIYKASGLWGEKIDTAKEYFKNGGSVKEYVNSMCDVISIIDKEGVTKNLSNKAVAAARTKMNRRTYRAMGIDDQKANMGAGINKFGYTYKALQTMESEALLSFDKDNNNRLKKSELIDYIDSLGLDSNEKKACIFAYFSDAKNPYGTIPNYLGSGSSGSGSSGGGGGSYGGRGGSGGGKSSSTPSWNEFLSNYLSENSSNQSSTKLTSYKPSTGSAYQKKIKKILDKMEV